MPTSRTDPTGLLIGTQSEQAEAALSQLILSYLGYRRDLPQRLGELLAADPEFAFAHILKALLVLGSFRAADGPLIDAALHEALRLADGATARERLHWQAARCWRAGDPLAATRIFEAILLEYPTDLIAFRMHHFVSFWLGRPESMLATVERVQSAWHPEWSFYGSLLACRAFANEEVGHYFVAENLGRRAVELDPGDPWGAHAVAHVLEMQGRHDEGIDWVDSLQEHWHDRNNLCHHLWWHQGLYHFEQGNFARALELYDTRFRNLQAPLTAATPDLYIDVQNAVSMLFRLQLEGCRAGDRWIELANIAQQRVGDCESPFTVPHLMLALTATERWDACAQMLDAIDAYGRAQGQAIAEAIKITGPLGEHRATGAGAPLSRNSQPSMRSIVASYVAPVCRAMLAHARGDFDTACQLLRPIIGGLFSLGGSHAQQELFALLYLDSARRAGRTTDLGLLMGRAAGRYRLPLSRRRLYRDLAD